MYINCDATYGSALLSAMRNKNVAAVDFLVRHGAVVTDRDYLALLQKRNGQKQLVAMVTQLLAKDDRATTEESYQKVHCWSKETAWSFPPTWKVAVALSNHCGLPKELFDDFVIPFCARDWFFTLDQRSDPLPARLGASQGEEHRNMGSRSVRWKQEG